MTAVETTAEEYERWMKEDAEVINIIIHLIYVHGFDMTEFLQTQSDRPNKWGFITEVSYK